MAGEHCNLINTNGYCLNELSSFLCNVCLCDCISLRPKLDKLDNLDMLDTLYTLRISSEKKSCHSKYVVSCLTLQSYISNGTMRPFASVGSFL